MSLLLALAGGISGSSTAGKVSQRGSATVAKLAAVAVVAGVTFSASNTSGPVTVGVITTTVVAKAGPSATNTAGKVQTSVVAGKIGQRATDTTSKIGLSSDTGRVGQRGTDTSTKIGQTTGSGKPASSGVSSAAPFTVGTVTTTAAGLLSQSATNTTSVVVKTTSVTGQAGQKGASAYAKTGATSAAARAAQRGTDAYSKLASGTGAAQVSTKGSNAAAPAVGATLTPAELAMLTDIWQRLGLDAANPLQESDTAAVFGSVTITKTGTAAVVSTRSGSSAAGDASVMLLDIWQRLGLDPANPMTATATSITAGGVNQTVAGAGTTVTVTRS